MTYTAAEAKELADKIEADVASIEADLGPQPVLRHCFHLAQSAAEAALAVPAGTLSPQGGTDKPPA